ncbi:MAG: nucleotidyltransferase domain-containing protein [Williamsia sp.]|nr:nucleotidyltransferase domain-containing protein [Williamsia sp.]
MTETILQQLRQTETTHNIRVLYACESGSRAWGFASTDSDYDVRFIYTRPEENYLSMVDKPDFIELPVDKELDINGWDIRKALRLFLTSNPPLYEWLQSPVVYACNQAFTEELKVLMPAYYSLRAGAHHYLSMTRKMVDLQLSGQHVRIKKYFYALRTALAACWIVQKQALPPMQFGDLRTLVADLSWQKQVDQLLEIKNRSDEKTMIEAVPLLDQWLASAIEEGTGKATVLPAEKQDHKNLDILFRKWIRHHDF